MPNRRVNVSGCVTSGTTPSSFKREPFGRGQRQESGIGLYYYGARWYDPALGRFVQPDTIVPDPGDAKSFDRYAYVLNNPLRYTDPTGHQTACAVEQCAGGREAIVGASTVTTNVVVYFEPPKTQPSPTYMHTGDGCLYGCTNGVTLYYIKPGEVYGQTEVPIPVDSIPIPSIFGVDVDASTAIVFATRGDSYVEQTTSASAIIGYEYSFTEGSGAPILNLSLLGDAAEVSAQLWGGNGEIMVGSNGASIGIAGTLPQYRILATSGQYLNEIGLEKFSRDNAEGYQLQSIQLYGGQDGYTGASLLYRRVTDQIARTGYQWPQIVDPHYIRPQ